MNFNCAGKTDIGKKRETNQDSFVIKQLSENTILALVCDGMGGNVGGREASSIAVQAFSKYVEENLKDGTNAAKVLFEALDAANSAVFEKAFENQELEGMGTTLVSMLFDGEKYYCLWVGDSRIYAIKDMELLQISHDHSFVQSLVDNGSITPEEAKVHPNRNIITKAVGTSKTLEGDMCTLLASDADGILICSDGLCGYVEKEVFSKTVTNEKNAEKCVQMLVDLANGAGGTDNVTAVVFRKQ